MRTRNAQRREVEAQQHGRWRPPRAQVAKFAEGESSVLMQKLARDRVKQGAAASFSGGGAEGGGEEEQAIVAELRDAKGCARRPPPARVSRRVVL